MKKPQFICRDELLKCQPTVERIDSDVPLRARSRLNLMQCCGFMHSDVIGLVTLDFELWVVRAAVPRMPLVFSVAGMDLDDVATDMAGFRIPADVIADFEFRGHLSNSSSVSCD